MKSKPANSADDINVGGEAHLKFKEVPKAPSERRAVMEPGRILLRGNSITVALL